MPVTFFLASLWILVTNVSDRSFSVGDADGSRSPGCPKNAVLKLSSQLAGASWDGLSTAAFASLICNSMFNIVYEFKDITRLSQKPSALMLLSGYPYLTG